MDIYNPNITGSKRFGAYMNQYAATSGRRPSSYILDDIIKGELDSAYNNMYRQKQFDAQNRQFDEQKRQFEVSQQNAVDTAEANRKASEMAGYTNLASTGAMAYLLRSPKVPVTGSTTAATTTAGSTTLGTTGATGATGAVSGSGMPVYNGVTGAKNAGAAAEYLGSGSAAETGAATGATQGAGATSWGPAISRAGTVLAIIAALDAVRQGTKQGDGTYKPYGEETGFAQSKRAPVVGATGIPFIGKEVLGLEDSNYLMKGTSRFGQFEEKLAGEPLDKAFAGDIGGSFESAGNAVLDAPRDLWNASVGALTGADTWICTQIGIHVGLTDDDNALLKTLRKYTLRNHREWLGAYLVKGRALVAKINETESDPSTVYAKLKTRMVTPILKLIKAGRMDEAFEKYKTDTNILIRAYAPELKEGIA
jgi:hypothetical protein